MATVPVFTHCPYFAVCNCANFLAKAAACFPGKGCPPHRVLSSTPFSAAASAFVAIGHCVSGFLRSALPPVIASLPTGYSSIRVQAGLKPNAYTKKIAAFYLSVGVRQHDVPHNGIEIVAGGDELPQR